MLSGGFNIYGMLRKSRMLNLSTAKNGTGPFQSPDLLTLFTSELSTLTTEPAFITPVDTNQ
jgi:hypothetical protein